MIGNDGQTVYKGIRDLSTDADDDSDGVPDAVELWENIMTGLIEGFGADVPWLSGKSQHRNHPRRRPGAN